MRTSSTEWVCVDCHLSIAGYDERETGHPMPVPFEHAEGFEDVSSGSPIGECGTPECVAAVEAAWTSKRTDEYAAARAIDLHTECDHDSFSLQTCAGCGSNLAGDRYAVTVSYWTAS